MTLISKHFDDFFVQKNIDGCYLMLLRYKDIAKKTTFFINQKRLRSEIKELSVL